LFLHDIEKPYKQQYKEGGFLTDDKGNKDQAATKIFRNKLISDSGFILTATQINAVNFAEGEEGNFYTNKSRSATPLAAFAHMCDHWSARGWHDYPSKDDPWKAARRS